MKYLFPQIYPDSIRNRACELYSEGMPAKTLAFMYGVSLSSITVWAQGNGIKVYKESNLTTISGEEWYPLIDYEGLYEFSTLGRVKSLPRVGNKYTTTIIYQNLSKAGYPFACLYKNGEMKSLTIHIMVAIMFVPNPNHLKYVNHKNGIKTDFRPENLEWVTKREDILHALRTGLKKDKKLGEHHCAKRIASYNKDGDLIKEYSCAREASNINGSHHQNITYAARRGKMSGGLYWKYI